MKWRVLLPATLGVILASCSVFDRGGTVEQTKTVTIPVPEPNAAQTEALISCRKENPVLNPWWAAFTRYRQAVKAIPSEE